ncbi:hypothetical protein BH11ACT4_BH11ACT4_08810 [soil metagenome]
MPTAPVPRQRRTWDLVLTIVLLVVYLVATALSSGFGVFLAFASDSCGASSVCNTDQIAAAMILVVGGVWVPFVILLVVAIVLLATRRLAFWAPVLGILLAAAIVVGGFFLAMSAVQPA